MNTRSIILRLLPSLICIALGAAIGCFAAYYLPFPWTVVDPRGNLYVGLIAGVSFAVVAQLIWWSIHYAWWPKFPEGFARVGDMHTTQDVILQLRTRARHAHFMGGLTIVLIFISLGGGILLFSRAEVTASNEVKSLVDERERLQKQLDDAKTMTAGGGSISTLPARTVNEVTDRIKAIDVKLATTDTTYITSILSTKIGSVLLLVFLVQILVTMYRYTTRLGAFYDSRGDALQLRGVGAQETLEQMVAILSPEKLDFSKPPRGPAEIAIGVAKDIASGGK